MRQRLSWDKNKVAAIMKKADPYTLNQDHPNNPTQKYQTGDTSSWAEDPDLRKPWEGEGRDEVGKPAPKADMAPAPMAAPAPEAAPAMPPAQQAVMAARKLEDKALKCITIAQRMLPGGADDLVEAQATDLMYMPERCILATLQRQAELADKLNDDDEEKPADAKECKASDDADKDDEKPADPNAAPAAPAPAPEVKEAAKEDKEEEKKDDAPAPAPEAAPAPVAPAPTPVQASQDLLDIIFAGEEPKAGIKKLSGIVKQASSQSTNLDDLWIAPPDVSKVFR